MSLVRQLNNTLLFFFIFTVISSALAFFVVTSAYDTVFEIEYYGG
ncbi:MAG: hypothetical protein Q8O46_04270 [bacterium]|nr:hypothetical protein [bacterium]